MCGLKTPYATYAEYEAAMAYNKKHANFSDAVKKNNRELSNVLPILQGRIMNFTEANGSKCNPKFSVENAEKLGYYHNCQTCTVAYELRRRGFNVEAMSNKGNEFYEKWCVKEKFDWRDRFLTGDGKRANYEWSAGIKDTGLAKLKFIEDKTAAQGRYEIYCQWEGRIDGHVFIVERQKNGNLLWYDPQTGEHGGVFNDYLKKMRRFEIGVMRIDNKVVNPRFAGRFKKVSE